MMGPMETTLDRYELRGRIGAGGLADVYAAWDPLEEREVALKILRDPGRDDPHVRRFLREGRLLTNLDHPRLPRCYRVLELPRPALVLERLVGSSLSRRLRGDGRRSPDRVEEIAVAMLEVLSYLHGHGIVHRDVKAGNIYLCDDGRVLLMDLGLAVDPADMLTTTLGDIIGTYAYMAPEQIAGAEVDHRCDLYSLGITLYEALAGRRPFRAEGAAGYLQAHLRASCTPLATVAPAGTPRRLITVIERLMARDPADRPYSARVALALLTGQSLRGELQPPPLVGRSGVLGAVEAVLDGGGVVHIVGDPGMGLGRCARQAWRQARSRGAEVIGLRCGRLADERALLGGCARALRAVVGPVPARQEDLTRALGALAAEGPTLLLAEDIDHLHGRARRALAAILAGSRVPALTTASARVEEIPGHAVTLRPLRLEETRALVCGVLTTRAAPPELVERLHAFSGGLPVVIVSTLRDLHRRGALRWQGLDAEGRQLWQLVRTPWITPTHPLRWSFQRALERLGRGERALLEVLAVADEELPLEVALASAGEGEGSPAPLRLAQLKFATERQDDRGRAWIGAHRPVVAAMTRVELGDERVRALHGALARSLEGYPRGPWRDARLPYHQALSVPPEQAVQALVGLGDWLASRQRYRRALDVLERVPRGRSLTPLSATHQALARGRALLALGRAADARQSLNAARRLAGEVQRPDLAAQALVALGELQVRFGGAARALECAEEALSSSTDSVHDPMLPAAMVLRAEVLRLQGHTAAAEEASRNAMDVALVQGRMDVAARAQINLAKLSHARGGVEQAGHDLVGAAELLRDSGDSEGLAECLFELSRLYRQQGAIDQALRCAREAGQVALEDDLTRGRAWAAVARAAVLLSCGDLDGAWQILSKERFAEGAGDLTLRMAWLETAADLRMAWGDRPAALAVHQQGLAEAETAGWFMHRAYHAGMVAILTARGSELSEALAQLYEIDDRHRAARLLLEGAMMTADVEILAEAREEIRALGDRFLLLRALHMTGGAAAREEICEITDELLSRTSGPLREHIPALAAVSWAR